MNQDTFPRKNGCKIYEISDEIPRPNAVAYFQNHGERIVKGDVIIFIPKEPKRINGVLSGGNFHAFSCDIFYPTTCVYDGEEILVMNSDHGDLSTSLLPSTFRIIEEGVPINYWSQLADLFWFNHTLVADECIKNIVCGVVSNGLHGIYTTFTYKTNTYRIVFVCFLNYIESAPSAGLSDIALIWNTDLSFRNKSDEDKYKSIFKQMLSQDKLFPFQLCSHVYLHDSCDGHTLFCA